MELRSRKNKIKIYNFFSNINTDLEVSMTSNKKIKNLIDELDDLYAKYYNISFDKIKIFHFYQNRIITVNYDTDKEKTLNEFFDDKSLIQFSPNLLKINKFF